MTVIDQLRDIADRLEAAEAAKAAALDELWHIRTVIDAPGEGEAPRVTVDPLPATESPASQAPVNGARVSGGGTVAAAPGASASIDSPRRARSGSTAPEGTPAAVIETPEPATTRGARLGQRRTPRSGSPAPATPYPPAIGIHGGRIKCPIAGCGQTFRDNRGYPAHAKRHLNGNAPTEVLRNGGGTTPLAALPIADGKDPREIHEDCPKCGKPFTWKPSLDSHVPACRGISTP